MKRYHLLDVYGTGIYLAHTRKQWKKLCKQFDWLDEDACEANGYTYFNRDENAIVFWIEHIDVDADLVCTIAHEASHATGFILNAVGHKFKGTDEPSAYLCGWLAGWVWDQIHAS
jgi:hypothetical protein